MHFCNILLLLFSGIFMFLCFKNNVYEVVCRTGDESQCHNCFTSDNKYDVLEASCSLGEGMSCITEL